MCNDFRSARMPAGTNLHQGRAAETSGRAQEVSGRHSGCDGRLRQAARHGAGLPRGAIVMPTEEEIAAAATAISKLLDQDMPAFFREQVTAEQIAKYATAGL